MRVFVPRMDVMIVPVTLFRVQTGRGVGVRGIHRRMRRIKGNLFRSNAPDCLTWY